MPDQTKRYRRSETVTRDEWDKRNPVAAARRNRRRPSTVPPGEDDRVPARAERSTTALKGWLERVEDRFMGAPLEVKPEDALKMALQITAGEVKYCDEQIRRLSEDELFERPVQSTYVQMPSGGYEVVEEHRNEEVISRWQQLRRDSVDRMARYAKMAIDVGLDEREQKMREQEAEMIVKFFERVMGEIELTEAQKQLVGPALRRNLEVIELEATDVQ